MQIDQNKKCLVLRLKDPNRVLSVIPTSKAFKANGKQYVAVKHGPDETKVLRSIGINAPSPILYHYDWPGTFAPFGAQREAAAFMTLEPRAFNLSDMGTGKTMATLWAYDYLRAAGIVHKALVVTPLSTLERTWGDEVFTHFPHLSTAVVYGSRSKRIEMLESDVDLYLINHDGIKVPGLLDALALRKDIDLIIIDEIAQVGRNAGTDRWRALQTVCNRQVARRVWGLTGTPTPNQPTDAWAQCRLISPGRVPPYFNRFKDSVMRQINQFLWVPRDNALDIVHEAMQPAIRFARDECIDLPPVIYTTRSAPLTDEQTTAYSSMMQKLCLESAEGKITAANEAVKAQKLMQIACGDVYDGKGGAVQLDATPRMNVLLEIIEESSSKVIVFVPFVAVIHKVREFLTSKKIKSAAVYGEVSKNERDRIFSDFQNDRNLDVIVAQPASMSHGLNLQAASTVVWFAPITSNDTFGQANARISRAGQKFNQLIVMIEGTAMERRYYQRLKNKQHVQGILLDMVQESRAFA